MACVSNMGSWGNLTGHVLAASNTCKLHVMSARFVALSVSLTWKVITIADGCGRLAWEPTLSASDINREWAAMTFGEDATSTADKAQVVGTVVSILDRSWHAFEGYTSPLGEHISGSPSALTFV